MRYWIFLLCLLILLSCAKMAAPGGGPEDRTPPEIVSVSPPSGTGYDDLRNITIEWSERLEETSAAVFLYPDIGYTLHTSGSTMKIELESQVGDSPLVIHLPKDIQDRRGNRSDVSTDLVYTSADSLPDGELFISMDRQGGGNLSAITLVDLFSDSVLVRRTVPDSTGTAAIRWLEPGSYRLLCYEDPDRSYQWSSEQEAGMDTVVTLIDSLIVDLTLSVIDTIGPILTEVKAFDSYHVQLLFNEEVSYESFSAGSVFLKDSLGVDIPVNGFWLPGGFSGSSIVLETCRIPDAEITAYVSDIEDLMLNSSSLDSLEFFGLDSIPADSLRIRSYYPGPGAENVDPAGPFRISFNYWVDPDSLLALFSLHRITDSTLIQTSLDVDDGRSFTFYPEHQLIGEQQYRFELLPGLSTLWGDTLRTPFTWAFSTMWGNEPGSIAGRITGSARPVIKLQISRTGGGGDDSITYAAVQPGDYVISDVPAGRYTVAAFIDTDGSGTWSPMEAYGTFPGVVLVQPGLLTEEVDIEILP